MQKHVNLVDLVKSFPTNIFLQNLASIQKRTSPIKFAHLAEKSENGSISNLSTKVEGQRPRRDREEGPARDLLRRPGLRDRGDGLLRALPEAGAPLRGDLPAPEQQDAPALRGWGCERSIKIKLKIKKNLF